VKLSGRKATSTTEQRRAQFQVDRARSPALRDRYPELGLLRIALRFEDGGLHTPSPQQHTLYPAARAFFRFTCPCVDCDGQFDLSEAVAALVSEGGGRARRVSPGERSSRGSLHCEGVRFRDRDHSRPCPMQVAFDLSATTGAPEPTTT
jgi:hypothetical protein